METWRVEKLVPGGEGLVHLPDGRIGFVPGGFPGDVIRPTRLSWKKQHARADDWVLTRPGPERVAPPCAVSRACGGCDWMELERGAELAHKAALLREALERTANLRDLPEFTVLAVGPDLGYRGRLRLHADQQGRLGLFSRSSHQLVPITRCVVADPAVQRGIDALGAAAVRYPGKLGAFREIEIRSSDQEPRLGIQLEARALPLPAGVAPLLDELTTVAAISVPGTAYDNPVEQSWELPGGVQLRAPLAAFTQVNAAVNRALVDAVVSGARRREVRSAADLFSGAGNFALPLAAAGIEVVAVEREGAAVRAAIAAARAQGLACIEFLTGDVGRMLEPLTRRQRSFDLVVLDPPREGAREALRRLVPLAPSHVALCSCDPVTLARDLRSLLDHGYRLVELAAFDMFPHTHHVEALAWLGRS